MKKLTSIFEEYLEDIGQKLGEIVLTIFPIAEKLIPKLLILNKLLVSEYTDLSFYIDVNEHMVTILQQIQSLKKLSINCTLFEDYIRDIFQIPQITSLKLSIYDGTLSEIINQLRYHEQSLYNVFTSVHRSQPIPLLDHEQRSK